MFNSILYSRIRHLFKINVCNNIFRDTESTDIENLIVLVFYLLSTCHLIHAYIIT